MAVPVQYDAYATKVQEYFHCLNYAIDVDTSTSATLQKKVRQACVDHVRAASTTTPLFPSFLPVPAT